MPPAQEARALDTITTLQGEIDTLNSLVDTAADREQDEQLSKLMIEKEELLSQRDAQVSLLCCTVTEAPEAPVYKAVAQSWRVH